MRLGDYYEGYYKGYMRYLAPGTAQGYDEGLAQPHSGQFAAWEMEDIRVRHINAWLASDHFAGMPGAARSAYKDAAADPSRSAMRRALQRRGG